MRVRLLEGAIIDREARDAGTEIDIPAEQAVALIKSGAAELVRSTEIIETAEQDCGHVEFAARAPKRKRGR